MLQGHGILIGELYDTKIRARIYGLQATFAKVFAVALPFYIAHLERLSPMLPLFSMVPINIALIFGLFLYVKESKGYNSDKVISLGKITFV